MTWSDKSAEYARYNGRKIRLTQLGQKDPGTIAYAGWDDWFIVRTSEGVYMVRATWSEIQDYLLPEEVK